MNAPAKSIQDTSIHGKKWTENTIVRQLTLYEDPIPVDFPHLIASEKHQVGQDQHGGGTRCKSSVEPPESLRGEELDLSGEKARGPLSQGSSTGLRCVPVFLCYQPRMSPTRA